MMYLWNLILSVGSIEKSLCVEPLTIEVGLKSHTSAIFTYIIVALQTPEIVINFCVKKLLYN